jgi:hypothetical protein
MRDALMTGRTTRTWAQRPILALACVLATTLPASSRAASVLLVIDQSSPGTSENSRKSQFESWGHTVTTIQDSSSQGSFDSAIAAVDVVYIPMTVDDWELTNKCKSTTKGVVCEERYLDNDMGFSTADGWNANHTQTEILSNTHEVTTGLSTGYITIVSSSQELTMMNPTTASGLTVLSEQNYSAGKMLCVIEKGGSLAGGGTAAGRRVRLPWGGDGFSWSSLNSNGLKIAQQAIDWAVGKKLLLHYKLDETSGTSAADASGNGYTGTVTGTPTWVAARRNNGFDFNGSTKIERNSLLGSPSNFTVACWARIDATDSSGAEGVSLGDYVVLRLHQVSGGGPCAIFHRGSGNWVSLQLGTTYIGSGWRHFAATFDDAANSLRLYVDGVLVASTTTTYSLSWTGQGSATRVGRHGNASTSFDLDGTVDDVRVYNYALEPEEVIELYGLVGHWKLNETSGTTASDSSGIGNNGTVTGTATWTTGARDNGFSANYTNGDDYITVANSTSLENVQEDSYTVAAWFKPLSTPPGSGSNNNANYGILMKQGWHTGVYYTNVNTFAFEHFLTGDVSIWAGSSTTYAAGTFHHVAATVNRSTGAVKIYVNGELQGTNSFTANAAAREYGTMPWRLGIGSPGAAEWRWPAHGVVDDARIYNRALDAEEVRALYGLMAHWKFNEGSGTAIADSSGNSRHAAFGTGSPAWISSGPYGNALEFSGSNDAVTNASFPPPNEGTVTFWFRNDGLSGIQRLFGLGGNWEGRLEPDGLIYFDLGASGTDSGFYTTQPLTSNGSWHHVAAVYDTDDESYQVYFDGQLQKSGTGAVNLAPQSAALLSFATRTGSVERFDGALDDFRIYDRKLTAAEVLDLYGLVGWYKFDETSGTVAADSSGLGNNGTYTGSPTLNVASNGYAALGTAVDFNGSNYVQVPGLYGSPSSVSVTAWAKLDASDTNSAEVVSLGDHVSLRLKNNSAELYYYNGSTWVGTAVNRVIAQTGWHHYAAVFDETGTYKLYIDGVEAATGTLSGSIPYSGLGANTRIGSHGNGQTTYDFDGRIDDVRIFKRPVTADEAYQLYRGTRINGIKILNWVETR